MAMHRGKVCTSIPAVTAGDCRCIQISVYLGYPKLMQENEVMAQNLHRFFFSFKIVSGSYKGKQLPEEKAVP